MSILLFLFIASLIAGVTVIVLAVYVIRRVARTPANGEIKRLKKIDEDLEVHKKIITTQLKVYTDNERRHHYGGIQ